VVGGSVVGVSLFLLLPFPLISTFPISISQGVTTNNYALDEVKEV